MPSATPIRPPISDSVTASTRNWPRMSRVRAPTAMRSPISRVRSVTDTSMMFMMPMPPTSSETEATAASSSASTRLEASCAAITSCRLRSEKSSSAPAWRRWRWRSSAAHLLLHDLGVDAVGGLDPDGAHGAVARRARGAEHAAARGLDRHQDQVVLVGAHHALALGVEHADHGERHALDADRLVERVGGAEQLLRHRRADQRHLGGAGHLGRLEAAPGDQRPLPHVEVLRA